MDWQEQLIAVYLLVCKEYKRKLCGSITRLSNYSPMHFLDEEVRNCNIVGCNFT